MEKGKRKNRTLIGLKESNDVEFELVNVRVKIEP